MYKSKIITVTPKLAKRMIEYNFKGNRKINKRIVDQYAKDMSTGRWNTDACPPISLAEDGTLMDGQHRLYAVIKANVAVQMEVREGVDKGSYVYYDCGKPKKVVDLINVPSKAKVASVGRMLYLLENSSYSLPAIITRSGNPNREDLINYINGNGLTECDAESYCSCGERRES